MKRNLLIIIALLLDVAASFGQSIKLDSSSITSFYRNSITVGSLVRDIVDENHGQEPSFTFAKLPSIFAYNDNGTQMGYSYFRIRGMGQERMNVTIDGMPWNEAEDFGCYFSNAPDIMSSLHSIKTERGSSITNNGTAAYAGNVSLESTDLRRDTLRYIDVGGGSFGSFRVTGVYNSGVHNGWGVHLRVSEQQTDGFKEHSYNKSQAIALKVGYYFNKDNSIDFLSISGYHRNGQGFMGVVADSIPAHVNPFRQTASGNYPQETDNFFMTVNKIQYKGKVGENLYLTSSLYWNHQKGDYRIMAGDLWNYDLSHHLYGANVTAKYYVGCLSITGGINAYRFQRRHIGTIIPKDTIISSYRYFGEPIRYDNTGYKPDINAFIQGRVVLGRLSLQGNLQYRHTSLDYVVGMRYDGSDEDNYHRWDFLNYGANAEFSIGNGGKAYASYTHTGKEPSRVDMFVNEYFSGEYGVEDPNAKEEVDDIEVGYEHVSDALSLNVNYYYMGLKNELVATGELSPTNALPLHQQKDGYRTGVEASYDWKVFNSLHWVSNASLSRNGIGGAKEHTFSPKCTIFSELNYHFRKVLVGVNVNYRSSMFLDIENSYSLPSMFSLNAYANVSAWKGGEIGIILNNVTNKVNVSSGSVYDGIAYYLIDAPFNFFINLKMFF